MDGPNITIWFLQGWVLQMCEMQPFLKELLVALGKIIASKIFFSILVDGIILIL